MTTQLTKSHTLVLDTATNSCSVALFDDDMRFISQKYQEIRRGHTDVLLPMINDLLAENNCVYAQIMQVITTVGPGGFTGLRVGISTAKGLAISLKVEVYGVTTTSALARSLLTCIQESHENMPLESSMILTVIDAKRSDVYNQIFTMDLEEVSPAMAQLPEELISNLDKSYHYYIVSDCFEYLEETFQRYDLNYTMIKADLNAKSVGDMFFMNMKKERQLLSSNPIYIRPPDAIIPKNGGRLINNNTSN